MEERPQEGCKDLQDRWTPISWYCPNCGTLVTGYRNAQGTVKVVCSRCHVTMIRAGKSRRLDTISIYAPREAQSRYA